MTNKKYVPESLSAEDKKKQIKSIKEGTDRPKVDYKTKRRNIIIFALLTSSDLYKKFDSPIYLDM